ncbi:MAG: ferredoxin--NADP reductase [Phreatobacter sp.]|uniref:ferredoxin--NADP reductase n=1 Tax=Phreatobacter sp. TaxID=1966341 RepID=UPI002736D986|nr:ferredoxin--NADP reductase [Phreatobacter sp.]MDP2801773.1 ferredoxin--NADP reductase [Phreatobacter sp.]
MSNLNSERVIDVRHYTDRLFSFKTTRDPAFRFVNGQFTMIGLEINGRPLLRAYSIVSSNYEDNLEFFSIKVPDGPLTSHLQNIKVGDQILVGRKPVGTLVQDALLPGRNLYLCGTGTGLAPFISVVKDPEVYDRFENVVLIHGTRFIAEQAYGDFVSKELPNDELIGELVREKLKYYPTVTREPYVHNGRITELLDSGTLQAELGLPPLDKANDRVMICGSPAFLKDMVDMLVARGFDEGAISGPGHFVIEKAFVEK